MFIGYCANVYVRNADHITSLERYVQNEDILNIVKIAPIINAPTILKNTILNISKKVIGIASCTSIIITKTSPNPKYPKVVNSFEEPIIEISGCTGLNNILSNSPFFIYLGPISYKESKQKSAIPIDNKVIPYNNSICLKLHPTKFSVF